MTVKEVGCLVLALILESIQESLESRVCVFVWGIVIGVFLMGVVVLIVAHI